MDEGLNKVIKIIGSVVFTAILYALPIILTCSFAFSWDPLIRTILTLMNIGVFIIICFMIFDKVEEEEDAGI